MAWQKYFGKSIFYRDTSAYREPPVPHLRDSLPQQRRRRWCDHVTPAFPTQQYSTVWSPTPTPPPQRLALGMADGERSPLLSDLGDGALGSGNGGVSPGAAPYGVPNKPPSEYPWCSLLHPTPAGVSLACDALHSLSVRVSLLAQLWQWQRSSQWWMRLWRLWGVASGVFPLSPQYWRIMYYFLSHVEAETRGYTFVVTS